jgi:hypothetical protein
LQVNAFRAFQIPPVRFNPDLQRSELNFGFSWGKIISAWCTYVNFTSPWSIHIDNKSSITPFDSYNLIRISRSICGLWQFFDSFSSS